MKRQSSFLITAALLLALTACGTPQTAPESTAETTAETAAAAETTANDALCRKVEEGVRDSIGFDPVCVYQEEKQIYQVSFTKDSLLTIYDKALQYDEVRAVWEDMMSAEQQVSYELQQSTVIPEQPEGHVMLRVLNPQNPDKLLFAAEDGVVIYDGIVEESGSETTVSDMEVSLPSGDAVSVNLSDLQDKLSAYVTVSVAAPEEKEDTAKHIANAVDLIQNQGFDQYDEIRYAAVAKVITPYPSKVLHFTLDRETIDKVKNGELTADTLEEQLTDLWVLPIPDASLYQ